MANAIIAYGNRIDAAELSGGSWQPTLPLANLQDRRIGKVARSSSASLGSTTFDIDFGTTALMRVISVVNHNLSLAALYRIRISAVPDFSVVLADSGWTDVWPVLYPFGTLPWGSPSWWTGQIAEAEANSYTKVLAYILDTTIGARYVRVEFDDTTNEDSFVEVGRLFVADGWQPVYNMVYGASLQWQDRTETQEALSGAEYFNERAAPRLARFELPAMSESEAMAYAFEIQRSMGTSKEVFYIWDPDDDIHALRRQFLGRLQTLSPIENPGPNRWRSPFVIKELL